MEDAIGGLAVEPEEIQRHILVDPAICHGQACVRGTRVLVSVILDALAGGDSIGRILESYPGVTEDDVRACLGYAALLAREQVLILQT
ncbi:MAG: DUF433 domain-containing protein [Thermoleophilia bacterium]